MEEDKDKDENKSKRRKNFTGNEDEVLKREVEKRKFILFASFSAVITSKVKDKEWALVAAAVNKVSSVTRNAEEVKQRWTNIKKNSKQVLGLKLNKTLINKTGGGEATDPLTSEEERMLQIIGKPLVVGVEGGFDTSTSSDKSVQLQVVAVDQSGIVDVSIDEDSMEAIPAAAIHPSSAGSGQSFIKKPRMSCNSQLVELQKDVLAEMRGIKTALEERNKILEEIVSLKKRKLELMYPSF